MLFRKAESFDIDAIALIYDNTHDAEEEGRTCTGWARGIYPLRETAAAAVDRGDMYVCEDEGRVVAAGIINKQQVDVYAQCDWLYPAADDEVSVLHTLVVEPSLHKGGYGRAFVAFYEQLAHEQGCTVLRIDTNEKNSIARRMYAGLGFREVDIVPTVFNGIPGVGLVMLEKKLEIRGQ